MPTITELRDYQRRLREARYTGAREIRDSSGGSVTYRSDHELASALRAVEAEIARFDGGATTIYISTRKGI